jgi:hypothetical protein
MREVKRRLKRGESEWRPIFVRRAWSGQSEQEFCGAEGLNAGLFHRWRAVLVLHQDGLPRTELAIAQSVSAVKSKIFRNRHFLYASRATISALMRRSARRLTNARGPS